MRNMTKSGHAALTSLKEAEKETLTVIKLKVSPLLRRTLSSTNPIESAFSIVRDKTKTRRRTEIKTRSGRYY